MSCNLISVPFTVTLKKSRVFFFKYWITYKPTYTSKHSKNLIKCHDWFYLYQGHTLSPENNTRMHTRVHAGYLELCYGSFFNRFNFKEKDKFRRANNCLWVCHHHGGPPQDVCGLGRTFIGGDKTHGLHKIRQKDVAYSYGCPHFSTVESDSPLESCWPVKARRSLGTRWS